MSKSVQSSVTTAKVQTLLWLSTNHNWVKQVKHLPWNENYDIDYTSMRPDDCILMSKMHQSWRNVTLCSILISELLIIAKSQRQEANWGFSESGEEMGIGSNRSVDVLLTSQDEVVSREHTGECVHWEDI